MTTSSNYSDIEFGMHNNAERYFWASYHLFGFLSSIIGDTLILIASFQKDAFKINKILVTVIQHIAVSDSTYTISALIPAAISLLANSWVLGNALCYVKVYVSYLAFAAGMSLITMLTASKFLILRYPLRAASWSTKRAHQVCSFIWAFALIFPILFFVVDKDDVHFDYRVYSCDYGYSPDVWKKIIPIIGFILSIVPNVIIIATTVPILKFLADAGKSARRVGGSVPWQGTLTVALTAVVYCISTLPYAVNQIAISCMKDPPELFFVHFHKMSCFLVMINVVANFYIYALTIRSFRRFLFSKTRSFVSLLVSLQTSNIASTAGELQLHNYLIMTQLTITISSTFRQWDPL